MGNIGNAGATAPKLSRERLVAIIGNPASDPEKARLAQEVQDLRTSRGFDESKIRELSGDVARLERTHEELLAQIGRLERAVDDSVKRSTRLDEERRDALTLLEQARTELADARAQGAA